MTKINWELMRPQDIEIRPATTKGGKATLLLYQDSRNTMDALDRNFGEFGWTISYKDVAGQIYGCLSIKDPDTNEWISKEDTGDESNIAAQKGQSSDILKRCAVRFGYGRELYTAPRITIDDDGYGCSGYRVSEITYNDNREINHLIIVNRFGKPAFTWDSGQTATKTYTTKTSEPLEYRDEDDADMSNDEILKNFCAEKKAEEGVNIKQLTSFYNYYKNVFDTKGWKNKFNAPALFDRWMSNAR